MAVAVLPDPEFPRNTINRVVTLSSCVRRVDRASDLVSDTV
jgi:hypothetical protein